MIYNFTCAYCDIKFQASKRNRKFCSHGCYAKSRCGTPRSEETKRKMSETRKKKHCPNGFEGKHLSKEHREKISIALKGTKRSQKAIKKVADKLRGRPLTEEHKRRIRGALKGRPSSMLGKHHTKASRKRISQKMKGRKIPVETRKKISTANKGKKSWRKGREMPKETKMKIAESLEGHAVSEETKKKLRCARLNQIIPTKNTSIERKLGKALEKNNIPFEAQVPLLEKFQVDFLVDDNLVIECWGNYWHNYPEGLEKDVMRENELKNAGYDFISFWGHEIREDVDSCVNRIKETLIL